MVPLLVILVMLAIMLSVVGLVLFGIYRSLTAWEESSREREQQHQEIGEDFQW